MSIQLFFYPFCFLIIFVLLMVIFLYCFYYKQLVFLHNFFPVVVSMNVRYLECWESPLRLSFLDTYSLSTSSLGCKALCFVMTFLVLWFICWSCSLGHFKNDPEYLTRATAQVFIPLMIFLFCNLNSTSFLLHLRYSFLIFFFHLHIFDGVRF